MARRRRLSNPTPADAMDAFVGGPTRERVNGIARHVREVQAMMKVEDFSKAKASHLVALYIVLHERVYGVAPTLKGDELKQAKLAAGSFLKSKCDGDIGRAVEFMRWAWRREREREKWRRDNHVDGKVLGWRLMLRTASFFTEYQVAMERRRGNA